MTTLVAVRSTSPPANGCASYHATLRAVYNPLAPAGRRTLLSGEPNKAALLPPRKGEKMTATATVDGIQILVERVTASGPSGRTDLTAAPQPADPATGDAFREMKWYGWPQTTISESEKWAQHGARAPLHPLVRTDTNEDGVAHQFDDQKILRPPFPIDLLTVPHDPTRPSYTGPRGIRVWFQDLIDRTGDSNVVAATPVERVIYQRQSYEMLAGATGTSVNARVYEEACTQANVRLTTTTLLATAGMADVRHSSPGVTYVIPYDTISAIEIHSDFSATKPLFGTTEKNLFATRGYGSLKDLMFTVYFSDGWRLCTLMVRLSFEAGNEAARFQLVTQLLAAIARRRLSTSPANSAATETLRNFTTGLPALSPPEEYKNLITGKIFRSKTMLAIPAAQHFGIAPSNPYVTVR